MSIRLAMAAALLCASAGVLGKGGEGATDPATGLVKAPGWELARAHCGACHSYRLVTAQGGDEAFWLKTLRWMQNEQNLWPIPEGDESTLISYLATAYPSEEAGRRPPLPARLMP